MQQGATTPLIANILNAKTKGYLAMLVTLLIWAGFFISLKGGANSDLQPADLSLMRFVVPAIFLMPFVYKAWREICTIPKKYLLGMFIGSGLPYLLVASTAMQYAPVSHGSALVPGTLSLFVTTIAVIVFQQPLSSHRIAGLTAILFGTVLFLATNLSGGIGAESYDVLQLQGHVLFLTGSLMWAVFTICARVANLNPLACSGLLAMMSCAALVVAITMNWLPSSLVSSSPSTWPWHEVLSHTLLQGVGAGIVASFTYLYAVKQLGAERSAAFGSATPVVATFFAFLIFDEVPDGMTIAAMTAVSLGSLVASNIFMKNDASTHFDAQKFRTR
ncbi:DMT family transporter [Veronia nyctiphanis]|nr:DMT family transporter [Veronia nyctiphanis]